MWTPVRGDEVGGYDTGEVQIADQPRALDDPEQLDQQVWSVLGQVVLVRQAGEEITGRVHRAQVAAQKVGAEEDQSPHVILPQVICCLQQKLLEGHSPPRPGSFSQSLQQQVRLPTFVPARREKFVKPRPKKKSQKTSTNTFYLCEKKFSAGLSDRSRPHLL